MRLKTTGAVFALVVTLGLSAQVMADTTAEDAMKYRQAIMTALRGHIGAASMTVRGLVDDNGQLAGHAAGLVSGTSELHNIFQEGSAVNDSEALPAIWDEPEKFSAAIKNSQEATVAFQKAVAGGDGEAIGAAFRTMGKACGGCHDDFRLDDD